jgi:hypothetical protein
VNKRLIEFFLKDVDYILSKSLTNCHCGGVDSIVFGEHNDKLIRMFVAHPNHTLYQNAWDSPEWSVAFHGHRRDILLECVLGRVWNLTANLEIGNSPGIEIGCYEHTSKIVDGECRFKLLGDYKITPQSTKLLSLKDRLDLGGEILHTIYVERGKTAAWMVYEGDENSMYDKWCYSNVNLSTFDSSQLYQPMTKERLSDNLKMVWGINLE